MGRNSNIAREEFSHNLADTEYFFAQEYGKKFYRNFPIEPGSTDLIETFQNMPTVIGAERAIGEPVSAHSTLAELEQTAVIDLMVDDDGRVRWNICQIAISCLSRLTL